MDFIPLCCDILILVHATCFVTGLVTSYVETAFYNKLLKER